MTLNHNRGWSGLPAISQHMYKDTYFLKNEDYQAWVNRITSAYANDTDHQKRLVAYIHNYWFHPSTPISSNGGTTRGLPISCFVGDVDDSKHGIFNAWQESCWLGSMGGGVGRYWSNVREINHPIGNNIGKSSGVIPFMCVDGALSRAVSQGGVRRFSQAEYLDVSHPEIVEFIDIRKPTGDQNRRDLDLHHGVCITDAFMKAVIEDRPWELVSPKSNQVVSVIPARELWTQILERRITTGEPYLFFQDAANKAAPLEYKLLGLDIHMSNLCTEIMLNTSPSKTNVCCLASINLEYWDEFAPYLNQFIADCTDFLDNVLEDFITRASNLSGFEHAVAAAKEERAIGLGVMGFHSLLQSKYIPFESAIAQGLNKQIFKAIREASDQHQLTLPRCPMSIAAGTNKRNIVTIAVAPTMSISNLCNLASSGVEPWISNTFTKKLKQGTFTVYNKFLDKYIIDHAVNNSLPSSWYNEQWDLTKKHNGSTQQLEWMPDYVKDVFKTAFELDQRWIIQHAADRTPYIDQGQSINLFVPGNSHVQYISDLHISAWSKGLKSLYYLRSFNPARASSAAAERKVISTSQPDLFTDTCLGCT